MNENYVNNGLLMVPDEKIAYKGYTIVPKRDFGNTAYQDRGNVTRRGYLVIQNHCNIMPGGAWFKSVLEAKVGIDILIDSQTTGQNFHELYRARNGQEEETQPLRCPYCSGLLVAVDTGVVEVGEWDGHTFEEEVNVTKQVCRVCGRTVFLPEG